MKNLILTDLIKIKYQNVERTYRYKYRRHEISIGKDKQTHEIQRRVGLASAVFRKLWSGISSICRFVKRGRSCVGIQRENTNEKESFQNTSDAMQNGDINAVNYAYR